MSENLFGETILIIVIQNVSKLVWWFAGPNSWVMTGWKIMGSLRKKEMKTTANFGMLIC